MIYVILYYVIILYYTSMIVPNGKVRYEDYHYCLGKTNEIANYN